MKANRLVLLAVAGTSMLALTGCTQTGNVAAKVGDTTIPTSEVDFFARTQCTTLEKATQDPNLAQNGAQAQALSAVRTSSVNLLVQAELDRQLAAQKHLTYDKATLSGVMQQYESLFKLAPAKDRERFRETIEDVFRGQIEVYSLAQADLATQGVANPSQDQVNQAVSKIQDDFRKTVDIEVNPEYGADDEGVAGSEDPSLSLAVSSFAKSSRASQPDASWVSKLPADQRCG